MRDPKRRERMHKGFGIEGFAFEGFGMVMAAADCADAEG
jgi:hypothetical protein